MKRTISIAFVVASLFAFAAPALADDTTKDAKDAKTPAAKTDAKARDYGYTFDDDPLSSNVSGTTGFILKVRPPAARQILLRPRTSFVPEMLKSVEGL